MDGVILHEIAISLLSLSLPTHAYRLEISPIRSAYARACLQFDALNPAVPGALAPGHHNQ